MTQCVTSRSVRFLILVVGLCGSEAFLSGCPQSPAAAEDAGVSPQSGRPDGGTSVDGGTQGTVVLDGGLRDAGGLDVTPTDAGNSGAGAQNDGGQCDGTGLASSPVLGSGTAPLCIGGRRLSGWEQRPGIERSACLYAPPLATDDVELPLVIFLPGTGQSADQVVGFGLQEAVATAQIGTGLGMRLLVVQPVVLPTALGDTYAFDVVDTDEVGNPDLLAIDHLIALTLATVTTQTNHVHLIGWSGGAYFAGFAALARSGVVASFAQYAGGTFFGLLGCPPLTPTVTRRVPALVIYRDCDALVPCDSVEAWLGFLRQAGWSEGDASTAELQSERLDGVGLPATMCAQSCNASVGTTNHLNWPTERMPEVFAFFRDHPLP